MAATIETDPVDREFLRTIQRWAEESAERASSLAGGDTSRWPLDRQGYDSIAASVRAILVLDEQSTDAMRKLPVMNSLPADRLDLIIASFEEAQKQIKALSDMLDPDRQSDPELRGKLIGARDACRRVFDNMEKVRWYAMEVQADRDIDEGRVFGATSVKDLMKMLGS